MAVTISRPEVKNITQAKAALEELEKLNDEIQPLMARATDLKRAVTAFAVEKNVDAIQLDDCYYRQINRSNRLWVGTPEDMPANAPKRAVSVRDIVKGKKVTVKGKLVPLWNLVTKRVVDPTGIDHAVSQCWITEKEISKAYLEKPQAPFLQRYTGVTDDG